MPRYSSLLPYQPLPGRGGRLSDLSRQELNAYVDQVAPDAALRFGNMARADYPYSMDGQGMQQALEGELQRMDKGMQGQTLDQAAVATAGVPILGDAVGLAADAKAVYDDPSWMNIGGAALGALPFVPAMAAIRAYHGSPHDFDKFDMSKIGTGDGRAVFGKGINVSEDESVARYWRDRIARERKHKNKKIYEVNINANPDDFVWWDDRFDQLPDDLQGKLPHPRRPGPATASHTPANSLGASYQNTFPNNAFSEISDDDFTNALKDAGYKGIRRLNEKGTVDYVVFDDALIDIIRKYGIGALLGGSGAFGLMSMQGDDGTQPPL